MPAGVFTPIQTENYRANLAALREWRADLVELLETQEVPASVEAATGRDGCATFRVRRGDGSCQWFGRSSMPTVSAPALVGGFRSDGRNVILPTIGTVREALIVEQRMPPHGAVFVYERDAVALKLGLHLCDVSEAIRRRRLVLLCGRDVAVALIEFFTAHPGFEFPQHLLPLPTQTETERERARVLIESAAPRVVQRQQSVANELASGLRERAGRAESQSPRVAVLSRDPRPMTVELAGAVGRAIEQLGWAGALGVPDRADRCHTVARLEVVKRHRPDLVVLLNCLKGPLAAYLPDDLPVCSWLVTGDSVVAARSEGFEGNRTIFAARPDIAEGLIAAGADPGVVHLLEEATDTTVFTPDAQQAPDTTDFTPDAQHAPDVQCVAGQVAVLSDAADVSAGGAGITQASHVRLWEEVVAAAVRSAESWQDRKAARLLEQAERKSGTRLSESAVRDRFLTLIRGHLMPTVLTRSAIERLRLASLPVAVWGSGWAAHDSVKGLVRGPIPDAEG
ncbi:MAG TPA: hypothetical protein VM243_11310, partial [Phycisphaerae bacterium]|nr:hypothetical protein [Phycisphaerae bacterium]